MSPHDLPRATAGALPRLTGLSVAVSVPVPAQRLYGREQMLHGALLRWAERVEREVGRAEAPPAAGPPEGPGQLADRVEVDPVELAADHRHRHRLAAGLRAEQQPAHPQPPAQRHHDAEQLHRDRGAERQPVACATA